jgi:hypothetical protein
MYGFSLLDDLHNFFPEILYDDTLFPEQRFGWFRHRATTLFPNIFTRQMNMYRIYNAGERQRMFQEWVHSQTIGIASPQPQQNTWVNNPPPQVPAPQVPSPNQPNTPAVPAASAASATPSAASVAGVAAPLRPVATLRYATPARTYSQAAASATLDEIQNSAANILLRMSEPLAPQTPQRIPPTIQPTAPIRSNRTGRTFGSTALGSDVDILTALFTLPTVPSNTTRTTPTINSLFGANEILSLLTNGLNLQDVLVVPTLNQIEAASRIILHGDVPADENCAICQEHTIPGQQSPWRRLHCSHQFHTSCIMPWFQRDVHCPVCRADIRELGGEAGTGGTGTNTPSDDMSLSSNETTENPPNSQN